MTEADVRPGGSEQTSDEISDTMSASSRQVASRSACEGVAKSEADPVALLGHSSARNPDYELHLNAVLRNI